MVSSLSVLTNGVMAQSAGVSGGAVASSASWRGTARSVQTAAVHGEAPRHVQRNMGGGGGR